MLRNYLAVALRNLLRSRFYTAINVIGLAIGVACCVLITLFVGHELSFDRYHANSDRIYRFSRDFLPVGGQPEMHVAAMAPAFAPLLKQDFPQVEEVGRIARCGAAGGGALVSSGSQSYYEPGFASADNAIFRIFNFQWIHGDPQTALRDPYDVVLTQSLATKYFGRTDVMGETLMIENNRPVRVVGVIRDLPNNTHLKFGMLLSVSYATAQRGPQFLDQWNFNCYHTYALLKKGANIDDIQSQAREFFARHMGIADAERASFTATNVADIHLKSALNDEMSTPGSMAAVYTFSLIAVVVLALACINFVNLATARAAQRAKEVGVRKVAGGSQRQLVTQFLGESTLIALCAVAVALVLVQLALPGFNALVQADLSLGFDASVLAVLAALVAAIGVVAGAYPAFYLSAFRAGRVLRGDVTRGRAASSLRKALVMFQFSISVALIIGTIIVYQQAEYARDIDLGYEKDQVVVLTGSPTRGLGPQWETLKQELISNPHVLGVTASNVVPGTSTDDKLGVILAGGPREPVNMSVMFVDFGFFETYGIDLLVGRTFSEDFGVDRVQITEQGKIAGNASFVVSELGARQLGLTPDDAVGKAVFALGPGTIVGVVEDVYLESIHNGIEPVVYVMPPSAGGPFATIREASIRIDTTDVDKTLGHIDAAWARLNADQPLTRRFLSQDFDALYSGEERQGRMLMAFSILSVFIAGLGLFGLASFAAEQRTKEIGIRRVLGGTVPSIVGLFTWEFAKIVALANLIAWPIAYFLMRRWLENFAYRIDIGVAAFAGGTVLGLAIAVATVALVVARAASAKPANSLRYE